MMKYIILIMSFLLVVGCQKKVEEIDQSTMDTQSNKSESTVELELWSYYGEGWDTVIDAFKEIHPNIKVKVSTLPYDTYVNYYLRALANKEVPDLMVIDSSHFGLFKAIDGLDNLLEPPYQLTKYKENFSIPLWNMGLSHDESRMVGLPYETSPLVTYYRADLMEKYGFPSDPETLGNFLEDPNNWLEIGKALKQDHISITQWLMDPIHIYESTRGNFNKELEFIKNDQTFEQAIEIAITSRDLGLVSYLDIWSSNGLQALKKDQIAMLYLGSWGAEQLKNWVPEQEGKWRVTRLPFNQYGASNSTIMAIPADSIQKEAAWKFMEFYTIKIKEYGTTGTVTGYLPGRNNVDRMNYENEFFGGQKDQQLYEKLIKHVDEPYITPLDQKAKTIWEATINTGVERQFQSHEIVGMVNEAIEEQLGKDIEILRGSRE